MLFALPPIALLDALLSSQVCSFTLLSASQYTAVRRKKVNFLAEPKRRKGVIRRDANCAWFHSAASMNARPVDSAERLPRI